METLEGDAGENSERNLVNLNLLNRDLVNRNVVNLNDEGNAGGKRWRKRRMKRYYPLKRCQLKCRQSKRQRETLEEPLIENICTLRVSLY